MRLRVFHESSQPGRATYGIYPDKPGEATIHLPTPDELKHLTSLLPRIKAVAKRELEDALLSLRLDEKSELLLMTVASGTSRGEKRFEFRALIGWIQLFDDVPVGT